MPKRQDLKTVPVAPLTLARSAASLVVKRVRSAVETVQAVRSAVKSVELHTEPVRMEMTPTPVTPTGPVRLLPMGMQDLALVGGLHVDSAGTTLTVGWKLDAYVIDRTQPQPRGGLMAEAACHFNSELRIVLHDTIDGAIAPPKAPPPKRLPRK